MVITKNAILGFFLVVIASLLVGCAGTTHKVGDSEGWAAGVDYYTWVTSRQFKAGDSLVFEYDNDFHDVTEVGSPLDFEFCNLSSTTTRYETGYDVVNLTHPGRYYFICGAPGHCEAGQRFDILVTSLLPQDVAPTTQPLLSPGNSPPSPSSADSPVSPHHSSTSGDIAAWIGCGVLAVIFLAGIFFNVVEFESLPETTALLSSSKK